MHLLNINKKMLLAIGLVSTIALSVTAFVTFSIVSFAIEEQIREQLANETIIKGEAVDFFLNSKISQIQNLAKNQIIQKTINEVNRMEGNATSQIKAKEENQTFLDEIAEFQRTSETTELNDLHILDKTGMLIFNLNALNTKQSLYNYASFAGIKKHQIGFTPTTNSSETNLIVAMPIFVSEENNDAEAMGTIIATIDMSEINQILRKSFVSTDFNESFLINKYHWIVSQSENKTNPSNAIPDTNPVANCFMYGENNYGKYENADNEKVYGFSYCINNFGIALLTEISGNKVLNPIINLQKTFFIVGITTVAGVVVVSFIVSTSISRPIMKLRDAADEIARGNFDVRSKIQSGDEIEQLSNSFDIMATKIQEYLEKIRQKDTVIKNQRELLLEFYESQRECCVGVIDIVNSTKITANLSDAETRNFYGTFINFMASIIMEFGATVVKNIGDAILFYFPHIDITDKHSFENVIDCCMQMIDAHKEINSKMDECGLSSFSYRISAVYGSVMVGHISTSSVADIFGSTVNACSKINRLALPNEFVIGQNLYDMVKSYGRFTFKYSTSYAIDDQTKLKVYSVKRQSMVQE